MKNPSKDEEVGKSWKDEDLEDTRKRVKFPSNFKHQKHDKIDFSRFSPVHVVEWMKPYSKETNSELVNNFKIKIGDEKNEFFDHELVEKINKAKSEFDNLALEIFGEARNRTNPYEKIKGSVFQNRAAVKMANISNITGITNFPNKFFYFVDLCGGPGGFSEFLYWKFKPEGCKGWGFTLATKGKEDWKLNKFNKQANCDNFEISYGKDGTGDIYIAENMKNLEEAIDKGTENQGVDLVMADGGFSLKGDYIHQEIISKQIILCQYLSAMTLLKKGGNFMCKLFDMYHKISSDLFFILSQQFEEVTIIKPYSSRVANSERYVVCKNFIERKPKICDFLFKVNEMMNEKKDVGGLIDDEFIRKNKIFCDFFKKSIKQLGERQLFYLQCIKKAVEDNSFGFYEIQQKLAIDCLNEWKLPIPYRLRKPQYKSNRRRGYERDYSYKGYKKQGRNRNYRRRNDNSFFKRKNNFQPKRQSVDDNNNFEKEEKKKRTRKYSNDSRKIRKKE